MNILQEIYAVIQDRQKNPKPDSYVCKLLDKGIDASLKKIGEEAAEVVIAAKDKKKDEVIWEIADLWFHSLVVMFQSGVTVEDVFKKLEERRK
jgi:phosphoribosyl-AMP cyclohydrolase / phosphoribosyl-ATP pyrophosphohydrolase